MVAHTHLLVLGQALLRLGELVAGRLLGHGIIFVSVGRHLGSRLRKQDSKRQQGKRLV